MPRIREAHHIRAQDSVRGKIVVYASRRKVFIALLLPLSLALLAIGDLLLPPLPRGAPTGLYPDTPLVREVTSSALFVMSFALTVRLVSWLFDITPMLEITPHGIKVHSWLFGTGMILWPQIASFRVASRSFEVHLVGIEVRDWRIVRAQQNRLQALLYTLSGWNWQFPRSIVLSDMVMAVPLPALMRQTWGRYKMTLLRQQIWISGAGDLFSDS